MGTLEAIALIEMGIKLITAIGNSVGAHTKVGKIIADRLALGRDWTDAEKQKIADDLAADKQYALDELAKPDVGGQAPQSTAQRTKPV